MELKISKPWADIFQEEVARRVPPLKKIDWAGALPAPIKVNMLIQSAVDPQPDSMVEGKVVAFSLDGLFAKVEYRTPPAKNAPAGKATSRAVSLAFLQELNSSKIEVPPSPQPEQKVTGDGQTREELVAWLQTLKAGKKQLD